MILLDSRFCGYDYNRIGFPSVQTCMAVVLETKEWLVGWHAMNNGTTTVKGDAQAFGGYVRGMGAAKPVRLYGVTHNGRHSTMDLLKEEMRLIASNMNYNGRISCFFMPERRKPQEDFVLFARRGGGDKSAVSYIDQRSIKHKEVNVIAAKTAHRQILKGVVSELSTSTFNNETQKFETGTTSSIRTSFEIQDNAMTVIGDNAWKSFAA